VIHGGTVRPLPPRPGHDEIQPHRTDPSMPADLTDADLAAIAKLLRDTIAADRFPLSPRVRRWQAILDKLEPPAPRPELPPLKPPGTPSMVLTKKRGRRR
jgi:hypothetical protein